MTFKLDFDADSNMTSLKGYATVKTDKLFKLFGDGVSADEDKVSKEWIFTDSNGQVFTLYDWKSTSLYERCLPHPDVFWAQDEVYLHVGGRGYAGDFIAFLEKAVG